MRDLASRIRTRELVARISKLEKLVEDLTIQIDLLKSRTKTLDRRTIGQKHFK